MKKLFTFFQKAKKILSSQKGIIPLIPIIIIALAIPVTVALAIQITHLEQHASIIGGGSDCVPSFPWKCSGPRWCQQNSCTGVYSNCTNKCGYCGWTPTSTSNVCNGHNMCTKTVNTCNGAILSWSNCYDDPGVCYSSCTDTCTGAACLSGNGLQPGNGVCLNGQHCCKACPSGTYTTCSGTTSNTYQKGCGGDTLISSTPNSPSCGYVAPDLGHACGTTARPGTCEANGTCTANGGSVTSDSACTGGAICCLPAPTDTPTPPPCVTKVITPGPSNPICNASQQSCGSESTSTCSTDVVYANCTSVPGLCGYTAPPAATSTCTSTSTANYQNQYCAPHGEGCGTDTAGSGTCINNGVCCLKNPNSTVNQCKDQAPFCSTVNPGQQCYEKANPGTNGSCSYTLTCSNNVAACPTTNTCIKSSLCQLDNGLVEVDNSLCSNLCGVGTETGKVCCKTFVAPTPGPSCSSLNGICTSSANPIYTFCGTSTYKTNTTGCSTGVCCPAGSAVSVVKSSTQCGTSGSGGYCYTYSDTSVKNEVVCPNNLTPLYSDTTETGSTYCGKNVHVSLNAAVNSFVPVPVTCCVPKASTSPVPFAGPTCAPSENCSVFQNVGKCGDNGVGACITYSYNLKLRSGGQIPGVVSCSDYNSTYNNLYSTVRGAGGSACGTESSTAWDYNQPVSCCIPTSISTSPAPTGSGTGGNPGSTNPGGTNPGSGGPTSAPGGSCTSGQDTQMALSLKLEGIGSGNFENNTPAHPTRTAIYVKVTDQNGGVVYNNATTQFTFGTDTFAAANIDLGQTLNCANTFTVTVKLPQYLPVTGTITYGTTNTLTLNPIAGDINKVDLNTKVIVGDDKIDMLDYSIVKQCHNVDPTTPQTFADGSNTVTVTCGALMDFFDYADGGTQGDEWSFNYNLWLRGYIKANGF